MIEKITKRKIAGQLSIQILIFATIAVIIISAFILWTDANLKLSLRDYNKGSAFTIAEAGVEYYRWHLAHASQDYKDGTGQPGPYIHNYYDKDGNLLGTFSLNITPPPSGTTIVTVESTGKTITDSSIEKIIKVKMGIPSFAKFAAITNSNVNFTPGTEVYGLVHSNAGVRFDGLAHNLVTSAKSTYDDPDHAGANEFGVHTHISPVDPLPPNSVPVRSDVFQAGRLFPVPTVDFIGITQRLADIKTAAQTNGFYKGSSGSRGYDVVFKTNDTFDLYKVTELIPRPRDCRKSSGKSQDKFGTWSIKTETLIGNYPIPQNNFIFLEDHVWVRGQINSARVTLAAGKFPDRKDTRKSITINNDLLYTNTDGQDVIGLIAQSNINVGMISEDDLTVDAALMAQNGRVGRYYYRGKTGNKDRCAPYDKRTKIATYGMIASNQPFGFAYTDGNGYQSRVLTYDSNLLYSPPPGFQLTSGQLEQVFWEEVK